MNLHSPQGAMGFRIIGTLKLATALMLAAAGFGIFHLLNKDIGDALQHFATRLHLDPDNRLVQEAVSRVSGIDRAQLKLLGVGTFFYAVLESVEGVGLLLRQHWAEYLTVVATALLLPPEIYEIVQKFSAMRVAVLLANLAILVYLILKLWQDHRTRHARHDEPKAASTRP
jgi:uncharacterized membrane protein (DUF2068 family)